MKLWALIRRESSASFLTLAIVSCIAGISNALVLAIINTAVDQISHQVYRVRYVLLFALALAVFLLCRRYVLITSVTEIEGILHRLRLRLSRKIQDSGLFQIEQIGPTEIHTRFTSDTITISQAQRQILIGLQSGILIFFTLLYIAWLSSSAFFLFVTLCGLILVVYLRERKEVAENMKATAAREQELVEGLDHLLSGFKEVKLRAARAADLAAAIASRSESASELKITVQVQFAMLQVYTQAAFFVLVAAMIFLVPRVSPAHSGAVVKLTTAILFLVGPVVSLVGMLPSLADCNLAAESILNLERSLDEAAKSPAAPEAGGVLAAAGAMEQMREIRLEGVVFSYRAPEHELAFTVGPIDLTLHAGECIFIAGGNGSGKSTLLKLISGLYVPQQGLVRVDGQVLDEPRYDSYRNLFAAVFSDYHLFDRLYGIHDVDARRIDALLEEMELQGKTHVVDGAFTARDLSTGQRKRLALLVALLEDRPVYLFDEWTADQDPQFRARFYHEIVKDLGNRGKTVVLVTHDDRYFDLADRVLVMADGRLVPPAKEVQP